MTNDMDEIVRQSQTDDLDNTAQIVMKKKKDTSDVDDEGQRKPTEQSRTDNLETLETLRVRPWQNGQSRDTVNIKRQNVEEWTIYRHMKH